MDIVSPAARSNMMAGIKGKHTKPELVVRKALFAAGFRFRLHRRDLPGAPDIVLPGRKVAVFVHGCFWHRHHPCGLAKLPATNVDFWRTKLDSNVRRDKRAVEMLRTAGWRVLVVWECGTRRRVADGLAAKLSSWIKGNEQFGEIQ